MNENVLHISDEDAYNSDVLNKKVSHGEWVLYIRGKLVKKSMNPEELEEQVLLSRFMLLLLRLTNEITLDNRWLSSHPSGSRDSRNWFDWIPTTRKG
jgi:hypothetical protein